MESVYDEIDWNLAGHASAATNNILVKMVRACSSPLGIVIPNSGATRHFAIKSLASFCREETGHTT